ncbi:tudor domain-containing protein 3-like [Montipora foliosa]|uniref:tudor domain-containing protein 3-like n=1 Tax=Montipora foliosa TaxID=591990 RepID=UPI0035F1D471
MEAKLKENGWFLSSEGVAECEKACNKEKPSLQEMSKAALNLDLKQYGIKHLPDDINKGKVSALSGPMVLQVQKLRNISAPKAYEESSHSPRLLKIQLTDGQLSCQGLENSSIPDLSLSIPPGTKVCLTGTIAVKETYLMLDSNNTKVLGGEVEKLKEKWELNKTLAKHSRMALSGEGPPPFVPFSQGIEAASESKGRTVDNPKVNGVFQNSTEKPRSPKSRDSNVPPRARTYDNTRNNRPVSQDQKESAVKKFANHQREEKSDSKRVHPDRTNNKYTADEGREKDTKAADSETLNHDRARKGFNQAEDSRYNSRTDHHEKSERLSSRSQEPSRGGGRLRGRGGRREAPARGRLENDNVNDVEDYRSRQPSEPALWDFLSTKFPTVQDSKNQKPLKSVENKKNDETNQERPPPRPPPKPDSDLKPKPQHKQDSRVEKTENEAPPRQLQGDAQGEYATARELERPKHDTSPHQRDGRQQSKPQREQYYKQQQAKGKGSRRHDHDSRPYNQSLPPRLQKKQQQQQQQRLQLQQQQQHQTQHHHQHNPGEDTEVNNDNHVETGYTSATSPPSVAQEDDAIVRFSTAPATHQSEYVEESSTQMPHPLHFQEPQGGGGSYHPQQYGAQAKWHKNYRQGSEHYSPQSFTPPNVQQQQQQHLEFVSMAMESQRLQTQFVVSQSQPFVERAGREQAEMAMPQEYQYVQQPQPPMQTYPVYQVRPAQIPQQQIAAQQTVTQQVVASPITATQVVWKKGDHCLAPWRDGQFYSAKMEDLIHDGVNCLVSFLDFHNSNDVVPLSSLRPFPIIAWGESGNPPPPPRGAVATVPYYAQQTPVNIVTRPQMVIPVSGHPPFVAGTRPTLVHSTAVHAQIPWQPAQVQHQEVRPAAFQPVVHYGAVPQSSSGEPGQAAYAVATGAGVHYVRGVKEIPGQDVYIGLPEGGRGRSSPNSGGYAKPRRTNKPTQNYYVPPRQQKFKDKG